MGWVLWTFNYTCKSFVVKKIEMSKHAKLEVEESEYTVSELTKTSPKVRVVCAACKFIASKFVVSLP